MCRPPRRGTYVPAPIRLPSMLAPDADRPAAHAPKEISLMTAVATRGTSIDRSWLGDLEDESIHILREVVGQFERPVLLFSGGKDSIVLLHLAKKAFWPGRVPFPVMHVDTGHNFSE